MNAQELYAFIVRLRTYPGHFQQHQVDQGCVDIIDAAFKHQRERCALKCDELAELFSAAKTVANDHKASAAEYCSSSIRRLK